MNDERYDADECVVPIFALNSIDGIEEQDEYLTWRFGRPGIDWEKWMSVLSTRDNRWFDRVHISVGAQQRVICFDITPLIVMQSLIERRDSLSKKPIGHFRRPQAD